MALLPFKVAVTAAPGGVFAPSDVAHCLVSIEVLAAFFEVDIEVCGFIGVVHIPGDIKIEAADHINDFDEGVEIEGDDSVNFDFGQDFFNGGFGEFRAADGIVCVDFLSVVSGEFAQSVSWDGDGSDKFALKIEPSDHHHVGSGVLFENLFAAVIKFFVAAQDEDGDRVVAEDFLGSGVGDFLADGVGDDAALAEPPRNASEGKADTEEKNIEKPADKLPRCGVLLF